MYINKDKITWKDQLDKYIDINNSMDVDSISIPVTRVKEFIRLLKERIDNHIVNDYGYAIKESIKIDINKLAGDKLI